MQKIRETINKKEQSMSKLDKIDKLILSALQEDARITNLDLAKKVGLSPSACLRRVTSLENTGTIRSYNAEYNLSKLGHDVLVLVRITLKGQSALMMSEFEDEAKKIPQILACFLIAGQEDYLLRIAAKDVSDFGNIHATHLSALPHVLRMESNFILRPVFSRGLDASIF